MQMSSKKKKVIEVFLPQLLPAAMLKELAGNTQKQSRHEFKELRKSIRENGFDESLLVRPIADGYEILSGNHRFRAGKAEGMLEFPCVVREDWDYIKSEIEAFRRNYIRGKIDKEAFTQQVDTLSSTASLPLSVIYEQMGFEDADAFAQIYQKEKAAQEAVAKATTTAPAVRILDDLGTVISTILAEHGSTVPNSFIIFPVGGKNHLYVATTPALKNVIEAVVEYCVSQNIDINIALGGLLQIGLANSNFLKGKGDDVIISGELDGESDLGSSSSSD
jgi:hypothetical protein